MDFSLQKKIEAIRRQPESVRARYAMICVSVSMVIVVGIWLLSVEDNVSTVANEVPAALQNGKESLSGTPSLNDLFNQAAPLRIQENTTEGKEFFNQQIEEKNNPVVEEE